VSPAPAALCVMWTREGAAPDAKLAEALQRPGLETRGVTDDLTAVAALLRDARLNPGRSRVLLLVEPAQLENLREVLDVLPKHANIPLWVFDPAGTPPLRSVLPEQVLAPAPGEGPPLRAVSGPFVREEHVAPADGPSSWAGPWVSSMTQTWRTGEQEADTPAGNGAASRGPRLRLTDAPPPPAPAQVEAKPAGAPQNEHSAPLLSDDELRMLLGEDEEIA